MQGLARRRSLAGLVIAVTALIALCSAAPAWSACVIPSNPPAVGYVGPIYSGYVCFDLDGQPDETTETWIVPAEASEIVFSLFGADAPAGGRGGAVHATMAVTPGEALELEVGTAGGASSVRRAGVDLLVAGGGDGLKPNYVAPGATAVSVEPPGRPNLLLPSNGSIAANWEWGWIDLRTEAEKHPSHPSGGGDARPLGDTAPGCVVPRLRGKNPTAARRALAAAGCAADSVSRRPSRRALRGRVVKQAPSAGTALPAGGAVDFAVGRRP